MKVVILRSDLFNVFLLKVVGPAFCVVVSLLLISGYFPGWNLLHASPFLIAAWFGASLAIVEVRGDVLRYRRLFKWTIIPEGDIVSARVVWGPFIGSMRLKRFVFPWGRLYFVLDANLDPNPFHRGEFPLLRYLRKEPILEPPVAVESTTRAKLRQVIAAVGGALFSSLWQLFYSWRFSEFEPSQPVAAHPNTVVDILFQILGRFEVTFIFCVFFAVLAIYQYRRRDAWIYAFLAGTALPRILLHWL
jgi:hypothetical protein